MEAIPPLYILEENIQQLAALRPLLEKRLLRLTAYFPDPIRMNRADIRGRPMAQSSWGM
jgi:hypothetical protein